MRIRTFACLAALILTTSAARADLLIKVDQSTQRMSVAVNGQPTYDWAVSTGKPGFETPRGAFRPNRMDADHYSQEYDNAPMPYAIFFDLNGHAIHGSFDPIGKPAASHGCVRLSPANAATLFSLVSQHKMANTKVEISGDVMVALRNMKSAKTASNTKTTRARRQDPALYGQVDVYEYPGMYMRERSSQDTLYDLY